MRDVIEAQLAESATRADGYRQLKELLIAEPTLRNYQFANRLLETFPLPDARTTRVAVLTSWTADFLVPLLKAELLLSDVDAAVYKPHFNQFRQEILNPSSGLYQFRPDVTIVAFNIEDVFPEAVGRFATLDAAGREALRGEVLALYRTLREAFRQHAAPGGRLLIQNLVPPFDAYDPLVRGDSAIQTFVDGINAELRADASTLDYARLVRESGGRAWTDPRTYYTARIPVAQGHWLDLARWHATYVRAALNLEVKCIVLDLDHTLWGGVLGEDGFEGIRIGDTYPGNVFKRFQEYLLALHANGYILAISSKNDPDDVREVLERHPGMVLRSQHFAAVEAHWNSKADGIREISRQIQISYDHMLFVDDNPVEIAKVRAAIPGISCLHLQSPPLNFPAQFEAQRKLGKLLVTEEDRHRGQQYFEDRQRREYKQSAASLDEFYRTLAQRLTVFTSHAPHVPRMAQLTQRTNQFNMTTIRLTEAEVAAMVDRPDYVLVTADLRDQFGDSGTIAYVQIKKEPRTWTIENWLMSCRVLGRTVEERLLDEICRWAKDAGVDTIVAAYVPTRKNAPFAAFYATNGFAAAGADEGGRRTFRLDLAGWQPRKAFVEIIPGSGQTV